ncbi:MAG: glycosyl transferase family 1 [Fluviicola sp. XM-24bin1]|nr:MAG: glycosyl transferase family 1 [Fluviicola sp. XM-24bin1]
MMKSVAVVLDNELDGDGRVLKEIRMLMTLGHKVHVLCFGYDGKSYKQHDFEVTRISISKKKKDRLNFLNVALPFYRNLLIKEVAKFLSQNSFDIVHTHDLYMAKPVYKGIEKAGKKIPMILDLHENFPYAYASYSWTSRGFRKWIAKPHKWHQWEQEYLNYADGVVFLSDSFRTSLLEKYAFLKDRKTLVLPNIPDLNLFNEPRIIDRSDKTTFLYFGMIGRRRGIFEVMEALSEIQKDRNDFKLLLIGPVDKSDRVDFEQLRNQLSEDNFEYVSWLPLEDLRTYMKISDVGICPIYKNPQHESGIANKVFQYMYGELALFVSNCNPQQAVVETYDLGFVFEDGNPESLKQEILNALDDSDALETMGERSKKAFDEHFQLENYLEDLNVFYNGLLES